ncbi:MAG: hypothetical protein COA50_00615 [Flavobacteriaceae bacterium]|nr:MAG: hypothetical protein COA50_00615 [Flavobacteriaceae bacterium]
MKKNFLIILSIVVLGMVSCQNNDDLDNENYADYLVAHPIKMTTEEFKNGIDIIGPAPIQVSGKIYAYKNFIFVNDKATGVHVIDNAIPSNPRKVAFIKIPGNVDISIKDDYLYADSLSDLIVIDISDINNINMVKRMEGVLSGYVNWPFEADFIEADGIDYEKDIVVGWETVTERRLKEEYEQRGGGGNIFFAEALNDAGGNTGQGGSLARFKIVEDYLYAVDSHSINVFNIQDLDYPLDLEDVYAGFDIETIFNRGNHLFLGSMSGMYIYDISAPDKPEFVSEFQHGTACDPVVVDGDYAYVTLRGGNRCGATESGLFIVDISNIENPVLSETYAMDEPYGLGIKDEKLFICDGASGLKVYDKTDIEDLVSLNHFENIITFDVIPLEETLLMVGDEVLYQYEYLDEKIKLISTLNLN